MVQSYRIFHTEFKSELLQFQKRLEHARNYILKRASVSETDSSNLILQQNRTTSLQPIERQYFRQVAMRTRTNLLSFYYIAFQVCNNLRRYLNRFRVFLLLFEIFFRKMQVRLKMKPGRDKSTKIIRLGSKLGSKTDSSRTWLQYRPTPFSLLILRNKT